MKVICSWCEEEGKPAFLREEEPVDDHTIVERMCRVHHDWFVAQLDAGMASER